jgi:hypothetical protein
MCRVEREDAPPVEFALPPSALAALLNSEEVRGRLPRVVLYVCRPVYSTEYVLLGPGYHPEERVLVHGPAVEPDLTPLPAGDTALGGVRHHGPVRQAKTSPPSPPPHPLIRHNPLSVEY